MRNDLTATIENIGEWCGRENYAVRRWNEKVLPNLKPELVPHESISYAHSAAWEAFCTPGGSRAAVRAFNRFARTKS